MNLSGVFRQLAMSSGVIGVLALACSYYAHMTLESEAARNLLLTGLLSSFMSMSWILVVRDVKPSIGPKESVWFVLGFWFITPLISSPSFWSVEGADSFVGSLFEATSNLTTLGATLGDRALSDPMRIWRSCLQFVGGVWSVAFAVVVLAAINQSGPGVQRSHFLTLQRDRLLIQFDRVLLNVSLVYAGLVMGSVIFMTAVTKVDVVDAVTRSVAAITTSATTPGEGDPAAFTMAPAIILCVLLFLGATNTVFHVDLVKRGVWKNYLEDLEVRALLIAVFILGLGLSLLRGAFDWRNFAESLSFISTSGMSVTGIEEVHTRLPQPVPETIAFIGGSALSTAGGIKIARMLILMNRAGIEFKRLAFSHAKARLNFRGRSRSDSVVVGVWVYMLAYIGVTVLIGLSLTAVDLGFETAFRAAIGAVSNVGPLVEPAISSNDISPVAIIILGLGSIIGRVEILAIAPLFTYDFWRK